MALREDRASIPCLGRQVFVLLVVAGQALVEVVVRAVLV